MFDALATLLSFAVAEPEPGTPLGDAPYVFAMDVTKILVLLTLAIYFMDVLRALLKPGNVRGFIRHRGNLQSRILAVGPGAATRISHNLYAIAARPAGTARRPCPGIPDGGDGTFSA